MQNLSVGIQIMPSVNSNNAAKVMAKSVKLEKDDSGRVLDQTVHSYSDTKDSFPSMTLEKDYVPFGEPDPYCFHFSWAEINETTKKVGQYLPFQGQSRCQMLNKGHILWNKNDPKLGKNFKMWRQELFRIPNCGDDCDYQCESQYKGIYVYEKCYSYSVVQSICLKAKEISGSQKPEEHDWRIIEGCYPHGEYVSMIKAIPGFEYDFSHIPIEVRQYHDPPKEEPEEQEDENQKEDHNNFWKNLMKWLAIIAFIIFLITFLMWVFLMIVDYCTGALYTDETRKLVKDKVYNRES